MEDINSPYAEEESYLANIEKQKMKLEVGDGGDNCIEQTADILLHTIVHNEKEAYEAYFVYAHHIRFSVHMEHATFWSNSMNLKTNDFVYGKIGFKKELKIMETVKYKRADTRSGCPTMIRYAVDGERY